MGWPQFNLKDMLLAVALIALGCGALRTTGQPEPWMPVLLGIVLGFAGPMLICAGVAAPFHRKLQGATVGAIITCALFLVFAVAAYATHRN